MKKTKFIYNYVDLLDKSLPLELLKQDYERIYNIPEYYYKYRNIVNNFGNPNMFFLKDKNLLGGNIYKYGNLDGYTLMKFDINTGKLLDVEGFDVEKDDPGYYYDLPVTTTPIYHEVTHGYFPKMNYYGWDSSKYENAVNQISAAIKQVIEEGTPMLPVIYNKKIVEKLKNLDDYDKISKNYKFYNEVILPKVVKWYIYKEKPDFIDILQSIE